MAYKCYQTRGCMADLCHSHSNARIKPCLQPTPQLMAMPDPQPTEWGQGSNPHSHGCQSGLLTTEPRTGIPCLHYSFNQLYWGLIYTQLTAHFLSVWINVLMNVYTQIAITSIKSTEYFQHPCPQFLQPLRRSQFPFRLCLQATNGLLSVTLLLQFV